MRLNRQFFACLLAGFVALPARAVAAPPTEGLDFFEKKIRPLLAEHCYECHATGAKKIKGGLLLDSRPGWTKGGDNGPALVPGEPEKSLLIKAVRWSAPDLQMPPKNKLTPAQIADLEQWVRRGAPDPRTTEISNSKSAMANVPSARTNHWCYQPLQRSLPPAVQHTAWPRTDADRFLLAALEAKGLQPVADADRATLARRAYFDLLGLPPTPEQMDDFANDSRPDAFARLVDQLLASPHFGEHWGRHWLDVVRFAESVTLRGTVFKEAWRYRDYVIDAFNRDWPYDQFLREQVAGDLLPASTRDERRRQIIATAFLAVGPTNFEEQDKKLLRMDVVDEQLDTIGKAFLAQTVGCARCHDHKFDPIPTRDYYAMAGILRSTRTLTNANVSGWIEVPLPVEPEQEQILVAHEAAVTALAAEIKSVKDAARALAGKSGEPGAGSAGSTNAASIIAAHDLPGVVVDSAQARQVGEWKHSQFSKHYIGDGYFHDDNKGKGEKSLTFQPELPRAGTYAVRLAYIHAPSRASNAPVTIFHAEGETTVSVNQQEAPVVEGRFVSLGQFRFEQNGFGHVLVSTEGTKGYVTADAVQFLSTDEVAADVSRLVSKKNSTTVPHSPGTPNRVASDTKALEEKLKQLQNSGPKRPMAMSVKDEDVVGDAPIHIRGSVERLGDVAPRGFLTVATRAPAPSISATQSGRKELGDWLAHPSNPLPARVMANRIWLWLMGEGLVRTPDNFGTSGEAPTHPELLDHLAARFIAQGWSVKQLVREIMLSRVYQLASLPATGSNQYSVISNQFSVGRPAAGRTEDWKLNTEHSALDPDNRLLGRMNRRRLHAECLRDAILAISGQLDLAAGGRTFPATLAADFGYQCTEPRRSVYVPIFRNALPEIFDVFDFASPNTVTGRRNVSTVAPQALFLMNHPFLMDQSGAAARRLLAQPNLDDAARVTRAYRLTLGRPPTPSERAQALRHLGRPAVPDEAWTELFHALFASMDFRHLN